MPNITAPEVPAARPKATVEQNSLKKMKKELAQLRKMYEGQVQENAKNADRIALLEHQVATGKKKKSNKRPRMNTKLKKAMAVRTFNDKI